MSASLKLPTIDCIRIPLYGFVEIEMDHIRFHPRSMGGSFSQFVHEIDLFSSLLPYRLEYPNEQYFVHFEIYFSMSHDIHTLRLNF